MKKKRMIQLNSKVNFFFSAKEQSPQQREQGSKVCQILRAFGLLMVFVSASGCGSYHTSHDLSFDELAHAPVFEEAADDLRALRQITQALKYSAHLEFNSTTPFDVFDPSTSIRMEWIEELVYRPVPIRVSLARSSLQNYVSELRRFTEQYPGFERMSQVQVYQQKAQSYLQLIDDVTVAQGDIQGQSIYDFFTSTVPAQRAGVVGEIWRSRRSSDARRGFEAEGRGSLDESRSLLFAERDEFEENVRLLRERREREEAERVTRRNEELSQFLNQLAQDHLD